MESIVVNLNMAIIFTRMGKKKSLYIFFSTNSFSQFGQEKLISWKLLNTFQINEYQSLNLVMLTWYKNLHARSWNRSISFKRWFLIKIWASLISYARVHCLLLRHVWISAGPAGLLSASLPSLQFLEHILSLKSFLR